MTHTAAIDTGGMRMRRKVRGFTLIELLVAIAIIGILAAIAMPSYTNYVRRANRVVAKTALMQVVTRQEAFMADRKTYATTLSALGAPYTANTVYVGKNGGPTTSTTNALYSIAIDAGATATAYSVTATAYSAAQKKDKESTTGDCFKLRVDSLGNRTAWKADGTTAGSADCWSR